MNLVELLDATVARQPEHPAIVGPAEGETLSYAQFKARVDETAQQLARHGVKPGHCVGLHCPSGRDYISLTYAIWRLGACVVPIPTELSAEEKMRVCQGIALDHVLSDRGGQRVLEPAFAAPRQRVDDFVSIAPARRFRETPAGFAGVNAAFIRFTSGTTGTSKGVVLSHETIRDRIHAANEALDIGSADTVLWLLSMSYHFAVSIVAYLSFGAAIVLARNHFARSLIEACNRHGITLIYGAPMHYELMAHDTGSDRLPSLRLAISTTIALNRSTVEAFDRRFGHTLSQALGVIEIGLPCIDLYMRPDKWGSVGRLLPAYELRMEDVGLGEELRRIKFRGKGFFDAYYDPWRQREEVMADGWFDTGDLGVLDADGYLFIKGRGKDIINVAGMKFFPQEVEAVLNTHPGVQESCVFSHRHELFGEVPHAQVVPVPADGAPTNQSELKAFLGRHLAPYKIPEHIDIVPALVRTASGKLVRDELRIKSPETPL
jgi:long-chain acyl-CoA synthetase